MIIIFFLVAIITMGLLRESLRTWLRWHDEEVKSPAEGKRAAHKRRCEVYAWDAFVLVSLLGISLFVLLLILIRAVAS